MSDPTIHHPFSPSSLNRLSLCSGSWKMTKDLPEPPQSEDASEGTMLHALIASNDGEAFEKQLASLTEEQQSSVVDCLSFRMGLRSDGDNVMSEYHTSIKDEDGNELTAGWIDCVVIHPDKTADIVDWKFGRTPVPDANRNFQLAAYALGVMQEFGVTAVTAHIFQPRIAQHTFYKFCNPANILHNIKFIISQAQSDTIHLTASDEACRYCKAASACPACNARYGLVPADIQQNMLSDPATLLDLWERAQMASRLVDAIKKAVTDYINEHGSLGDWTMEQRAGRREFNDNSAVLARVSDLLTPTDLAQCYSISVTSVIDKVADVFLANAKYNGEKLLKKDAKRQAESLLDGLIVRKDGSAVLTKGAKKA